MLTITTKRKSTDAADTSSVNNDELRTGDLRYLFPVLLIRTKRKNRSNLFLLRGKFEKRMILCTLQAQPCGRNTNNEDNIKFEKRTILCILQDQRCGRSHPYRGRHQYYFPHQTSYKIGHDAFHVNWPTSERETTIHL